MNNQFTETMRRWHEFVETQNDAILEEILADEVKFHSPFVWKPKDGKQITIRILNAAVATFQDFRYVRIIADESNHALEFEARVGELTLRGVDLIELNDAGQIIDFEVMVRPANALAALGAEMTGRLGL